MGFGYPGKFSAKYTFDDQSTSNWLVGLENHEGYDGKFTTASSPANDLWTWYTTDAWPTRVILGSSYFPEGFAYAVPPPMWAGWRGFVHVLSDEDFEVEVWSGALNVDGVGEQIEPGINYTDEQSTITAVRGGEWTRVDFFHPYEDETGEYPARPATHNNEISTFYWQQRIRVKGGSLGQSVFLDNCYVWPDLRNFTTPLITIGVYEWVRDEHGGYIGAKLWFKVGIDE